MSRDLSLVLVVALVAAGGYADDPKRSALIKAKRLERNARLEAVQSIGKRNVNQTSPASESEKANKSSESNDSSEPKPKEGGKRLGF